jgi:hypothetical protein
MTDHAHKPINKSHKPAGPGRMFFVLTAAAYNLIRIPKLLPAAT